MSISELMIVLITVLAFAWLGNPGCGRFEKVWGSSM